MIGSFRHRALKRFHEQGNSRQLPPDQLKRIRRILMILDNAGTVEDMEMLPGMRLHPLKGDLKDYWSISVSGNWRIIFRFFDGHAFDVDLVDYH